MLKFRLQLQRGGGVMVHFLCIARPKHAIYVKVLQGLDPETDFLCVLARYEAWRRFILQEVTDCRAG